MIGVTEILYLSELAAVMIALILETLIFVIKKKEGLLKYFGITLAAFLVLFVLTFIFEKPQMNISQNQIIEVGTNTEIVWPKTIYHFKDITMAVKVQGDVDYNKVGEYDIAYVINTSVGKYEQKSIFCRLFLQM